MGGIVDITQTTWGALGYGLPGWGGSSASLTGLSITATLGDLAYAAADDGWGRDAWGDNAWGENATTVILDGLEMTGRMGPDAWGTGAWSDSTWGGDPFILSPADVVGLTGIEATGSVGTPQLNYDFKLTLTESLLATGYLGSPSINNGADHTQGLGGIAATMSLGTPTAIQEVVGLTGIEMTGALNASGIVIGELTPVDITGIAATAALGSLESIPDMARGLTGLSSTMSLGSLGAIDDMQVGLSGFEITATLNPLVSPLHYKTDSITGSTSYTSVDITGSTTYTIDEHAA